MFESTVDDPSISCRMIPAPSLFAEPSSPRAMYGLSAISNNLADPKQRTKNQHLVFVVVIYVCGLALQGHNRSRDLDLRISITHIIGVVSGKYEPSMNDN